MVLSSFILCKLPIAPINGNIDDCNLIRIFSEFSLVVKSSRSVALVFPIFIIGSLSVTVAYISLLDAIRFCNSSCNWDGEFSINILKLLRKA